MDFLESSTRQGEPSFSSRVPFRAQKAFEGLKRKINNDEREKEFQQAVQELEGKISAKLKQKKKRSLEKHGEYFEVLHRLIEKKDPAIKKIRKILIRAGLAFPLWYGDWDVDRPDETHGEYTGTRPHKEICTFITERQKKAGLLHETEPSLTGLILGPGNGYGMHELQNNTTTLEDGKSQVRDHWNFVGLCDKMYFPLAGLLSTFWKGKKEVKEEFCRFLATQIQYAVQDWRNDPKNHNDRHPLQKDISTLRTYLEENPHIVNGRIHDGCYSADGEFSDGSKKIPASTRLQKLIEIYQKNPSGFLRQNFKTNFTGDAILENAPLFFRNIHIGKFDQLEDRFPGEDLFDFISSVRGSSHIDNEPYKNLIEQSLRKLKPGGILIDDGIRRSYSRELRLKEVREIEKSLPDDYRLSLIYDAEGNIRSLFAQRALVRADRNLVRGDEKKEEKKLEWIDDATIQEKILKKRCTIHPIGSPKKGVLRSKTFQEVVRTRIMKKLLEKYRDRPSYFSLLGKLSEVHQSIDTYFAEGNKAFGSKEVIKNTFEKVIQIFSISAESVSKLG